MCAGAIINARIPRVVYGASDRKCGAVNSVCSLFSMEFNHHPQVETGVREAECGALLTEFFRSLRAELRSRPKWKPGSGRSIFRRHFSTLTRFFDISLRKEGGVWAAERCGWARQQFFAP